MEFACQAVVPWVPEVSLGQEGSLRRNQRVGMAEREMGKQQPKTQTLPVFGSSLGIWGEEITGTMKALRNYEICDCSLMCKKLKFH